MGQLYQISSLSQIQLSIKHKTIIMNTFDIDLDDGPENSSNVNQRLANSATKYAANTYTKGFFNEEEEAYLQASLDSPNPTGKKGATEKEKQSERKRRSRKGAPIKLEPMKQEKKVSVFQNYNRDYRDEDNELEEISYEPQKVVKKEPEPKRQEKQKKREEPVAINIPRSAALVFEDEDEGESRDNPTGVQFLEQNEREVRDNNRPNYFGIPQRRQLGEVFQHDSDDADIVDVNGDIEQTSIVGPQYFSYDSNQSLKRQLVSSIRPGSKLRMELIRDKSGFNTIWPEFQLHFAQNSHFLMNAKKTSSKPTSTFIITCRKGDFQEKSQYYLGKMKSNVLGDMLNVFGPGLNPSNAKQQSQIPRQLLATIVYSSSIFQMGRPREFAVYVKKSDVKYYNHFPQVRMYEDEIPLNTLYESPENRDKIVIYGNRKPQWVENLGGYMLNFKGRVEKASIKNFILEENGEGPEIVLFGKVTDSKFNLDMSHPISPIVAFAVSLSSFDTRIMCE